MCTLRVSVCHAFIEQLKTVARKKDRSGCTRPKILHNLMFNLFYTCSTSLHRNSRLKVHYN